MPFSKALGSEDISGFDFVKEILDGVPTFAIIFVFCASKLPFKIEIIKKDFIIITLNKEFINN